MLDYLQKAREYLWAFVELGFLAILTVMLIYLIMGQELGVSCQESPTTFSNSPPPFPAQSLVGIAIVLALIFMLSKRVR